jgi:hypothetical protein
MHLTVVIVIVLSLIFLGIIIFRKQYNQIQQLQKKLSTTITEDKITLVSKTEINDQQPINIKYNNIIGKQISSFSLPTNSNMSEYEDDEEEIGFQRVIPFESAERKTSTGFVNFLTSDKLRLSATALTPFFSMIMFESPKMDIKEVEDDEKFDFNLHEELDKLENL